MWESNSKNNNKGNCRFLRNGKTKRTRQEQQQQRRLFGGVVGGGGAEGGELGVEELGG